MKTLRCEHCGRPLHDGDVAFEHDYNRIRIRGKSVDTAVVTVLLCETCEPSLAGTRGQKT